MRTVQQIDKDIDANRDALLAAYGHKPRTAGGWQKAWDAFPEFRTRDNELFRERGEAQVVRDEKAAKVHARQQRVESAKQRKESAAKFKAQRALEAAAPAMLAALQAILHPDNEAIAYFVPSDAWAQKLRADAVAAVTMAVAHG